MATDPHKSSSDASLPEPSAAAGPMDLKNYGLLQLNGQPEARERTVIVLGVARSGTSMLANILVQLGLFMGERRDGIVFEDVDLAEAFEQGNLDQARSIIDRRNQSHASWGWKRPEAFKYLAPHLSAFRNPCLIVTIRDILAIGLRNVISTGLEPEVALKDAQARYAALLQFLDQVSIPTLLISYEKALLNAPAVIERIAEFAGLNPSPFSLRAALESIELDRPEYLQGARVRQFLGHVGQVRDGKLFGWAKAKDSDTRRLSVTATIDGHTEVTAKANLMRKDLAGRGVGDGRFGFAIDISEHLTNREMTLRVFESSTGEEIGGSPKVINTGSA